MAKKESAELLLIIKSAGEEALEKVGDALKGLGKIALSAFGVISGLIAASIHEFRQQEEATNSLNRAMINSGMYTKELSAAYAKQAEELSKLTLFKGEEITAGQAVAQQQIGQTKISKELTKAILDFAAAQKVDVASAAETVGKAIGTSTNALGRYGIEVAAGATKSERMEQVLAGLNQKFGGQAEAAAKGATGFIQLQHVLEDLLQTIGERIAPAFGVLVQYIKDLIPSSQDGASAFDGLVAVLNFGMKAVIGLSEAFVALGEIIGTSAAAAFEAFNAIATGNFSKLKEIASTSFEDMGNSITEHMQNAADRMTAIDEASIAAKQQRLLDEQQMELQSRQMHNQVLAEETATENVAKLERMLAQQQIEMEQAAATEEQKTMAALMAQKKRNDLLLKETTDAKKKEAILQDQYRLNEQIKEEAAHQRKIQDRKDTFSTIATLQRSSNSELAAIGKAAAITQIAIETPVAIARALGAFPPPFNFVAAGLVAAAMATQAANIAGVPLAQGGIVLPTPGGTQATIGEGGQAEAVIPLDRAGDFGFGGGGGTTVHITVNGGMLGSESEAREFAIAVDKELLKLRQNNESQAFDSGIV